MTLASPSQFTPKLALDQLSAISKSSKSPNNMYVIWGVRLFSLPLK